MTTSTHVGAAKQATRRGSRPARVGGGRPARDRGSATLELVVLAPALLAVIGLVLVAGRVTIARGAVEQSAAAAARSASLSRTATGARAAGLDAARDALAERGLRCAAVDVRVDTTGFTTRPGRYATVTARVTCTVALTDLALPGIPGSRAVTATAVSPLDTYRSRADRATSTGGLSAVDTEGDSR